MRNGLPCTVVATMIPVFAPEADPEETDNLAKSDDHRAVWATLGRRCAAHSQSFNEQGRTFRGAVQVQSDSPRQYP